MFRRRQWQPTPVLLPEKSHGWRSLVGCSPWGRYESDTTEWLHFYFSLSCTGEGNGNPLQCSCLENPRDRGAWWAAVYGVAQSRTRLKRLSSSSKEFDLYIPNQRHSTFFYIKSFTTIQIHLPCLTLMVLSNPFSSSGSPSPPCQPLPTLTSISTLVYPKLLCRVCLLDWVHLKQKPCLFLPLFRLPIIMSVHCNAI